ALPTSLRVDDPDRHRDRDLSARPNPHEIDMQRSVADRMVLDIARQRAQRRAVEADVDERREQGRPRQHPPQLSRFEADRYRLLAVAVDDRRNTPGAARRTRSEEHTSELQSRF